CYHPELTRIGRFFKGCCQREQARPFLPQGKLAVGISENNFISNKDRYACQGSAVLIPHVSSDYILRDVGNFVHPAARLETRSYRSAGRRRIGLRWRQWLRRFLGAVSGTLSNRNIMVRVLQVYTYGSAHLGTGSYRSTG